MSTRPNQLASARKDSYLFRVFLILSVVFGLVMHYDSSTFYTGTWNYSAEPILGLLVIVRPIPEARRLLDTEKEKLESEAQAFREFLTQVQSIANGPSPTTPIQKQDLLTNNRNKLIQNSILEAYSKTVMAVPHFEEDYAESMAQNIASEFSADLATILVGDDPVPHTVIPSLMAHSRTAIHHREEFLQILEQEDQSICQIFEVLEQLSTDINRSEPASPAKSELFETGCLSGISNIDTTCQSLLTKRQQEIHSINKRHSQQPSPFVQQYLYQELDVTFPVLNALLDTVQWSLRKQRELICASETVDNHMCEVD